MKTFLLRITMSEYIIFFRRFQTNIRIFNRMIDTSNFVCNYSIMHTKNVYSYA